EENPDLDAFRRKWQAEVRAKTHRKQSTDPGITPATSATTVAPSGGSGSGDILASAADHSKLPSTGSANSAWTSSLSSKDHSALGLYSQAIAFEQEGQLGEALQCYQRAFRLHGHVDNLYRKVTQLKVTTNPATITTTAGPSSTKSMVHVGDGTKKVDYPPVTAALDNGDQVLDQGTGSNQPLPLPIEPLNPDQPCWIAELPRELQVIILRHLLVMDLASVSRFAQVCQTFRALTQETALWRWACEYVFSSPALEITDGAAKPSSGGIANDARRRIIDRGSIRGVYVSTCYYARPGRTENTWYQPVHMVTYYRYMRFYRDGRCLKWLTTDEPKKAIKALKWDPLGIMSIGSRRKGLMYGTYAVSTQGQLWAVVCDPDRPTLTFFIHAQAKSSAQRGRHNKLNWLSYASMNLKYPDEVVTYSLTDFRPFYFSRVRSYGA
ncbi:hypothetical protein BJ085DRAFT_12245, partial [Dimargaris cristalligena]